MSKIIKLTPQEIETACEKFKKALLDSKLSNGKFNYTESFSATDQKATVWFAEKAWLKMQSLVQKFDSEVAWHGIATRGEPGTNDYFIHDILVYPQEVSGTTVTPDQQEYQMWLMELETDIFNNLRMQGHSHVNMSTTPSSVDETWYESILDQLSDDMFYIFMVWNKRGERHIKIYDLAKNILFETADITVEILESDLGISRFMEEAKELVKTKVYTSTSATAKAAAGTYYGAGYPHGTSHGTPVTKSQASSEQSCPEGSTTKKKKKAAKNAVSFDDAYLLEMYGGQYGDYNDPYGTY